jgi:hypothetical protein
MIAYYEFGPPWGGFAVLTRIPQTWTSAGPITVRTSHMNMETLTDIPFVLGAPALMAWLRIEPDSEDAGEFEALLDLTRRGAKPKAVYSMFFIEDKGVDTVTLNGITFASRALRRNLADVERVFAYVATCGQEVDAVLPVQGDLLKDYWREVIKESLLESATTYLFGELQRKYRIAQTATMNPGSGDATVWPIEQQRELFALLGDVEAGIGVQLTPSYLMVPNKTVSGILFPTERDFRTCQVCHRDPCPNRRAPFDAAMWAALQ